jgi:protein-tyrosine phosphatase
LIKEHKLLLRKIYSQESFTINFICSGNIIRSPYAEILFEKLLEQHYVLSQKIKVESGGVKYKNSMISGESASMLIKGGVSKNRIDQFSPRFFGDYPNMFENNDLILVMEKSHLQYIPQKYKKKAYLFLDFVYGQSIGNVPDPYFNPPYERAYNMIKEALETLLEQIIQING